MRRSAQPAFASPLLAAIASGTLDRATATRKAALTLPLTTIVRPSTIDSGIPSSTIPSTIASAEPSACRPAGMLAVAAADSVDEQVARVEDHGPRDEAESDAASTARLVERLLDELERDGADQNAAAEGHDHAERPLSDGEPEREGAAHDQGRGGGEAPCEGSEHRAGIITGRADAETAVSILWCREPAENSDGQFAR